MTTAPEPPPRVRVTGPRTGRRPHPSPGGPGRSSVGASVAGELDEQTRLGEIYLRSLMRSQLRLALGTTALLLGTIGLLPLGFLLVPALQEGRLAGVPVAWVLLGVVAYPVLIVLALGYVRRAERNERAFSHLVDPRGDP